MRRYRAVLAYDGTAYQGFQRQAAGIPTIQERVERALLKTVGVETTVHGAGRTDTGVHAVGQVIAFDAEWTHGVERLLPALNMRLPRDIALQSLNETHARFHPRFDALSRMYLYTVYQAPAPHPFLRHRALYILRAMDAERLNAAASLLIGTHDFATFGNPPEGDNTVRTLWRSEWAAQPDPHGATVWTYTIEGNAFLQHMVRRLVGMLVMVGRGARTVAQFEADFRRAKLADSVALAPPGGLVLQQVNYPSIVVYDDEG